MLVVIGIGGSYLGAKAAIDFLRSPNYNTIRKRTPDIYFIGNSFSGSEILEVISLCEGKDVSVNVVSKSGTTTESAIAFRVMLSYMQSRYSKDELRRRIFATTDAHTGALKQLADENGFETYVVPEDIGGRFSSCRPSACCRLRSAGRTSTKSLPAPPPTQRRCSRRDFPTTRTSTRCTATPSSPTARRSKSSAPTSRRSAR